MLDFALGFVCCLLVLGLIMFRVTSVHAASCVDKAKLSYPKGHKIRRQAIQVLWLVVLSELTCAILLVACIAYAWNY